MSVYAQRVQLGPFFDGGNLAGAALLYHYEPGTTTQKDMWSDRSMATTVAQPLVSDANGIFDFFADGLYKIVIKKSDGTTLKTLDNWKFVDVAETSFVEGAAVDTASTVNIGTSAWAHWTGSVDVAQITGDSLFYWAVASGNFTLIHSSSLVMPDSRDRKVLSGDVLFFLNDGGGVFRLGGHFQTEGGWTGRGAATVAAASNLDVPTDGDFISISGTSDVNSISAAPAGYRFTARFTGTGLNINHNATSMISPWGYDYRTTVNEVIEFLSLGSGNWMFWSLNGPGDRTGASIEWNSTNLPNGYLWEDGSTVSRSTYSGLYAYLLVSSLPYGNGDGSTTFTLPDSRGRVAIMVDGAANRITSSSTNGANADTLGGVGGAQTHTLVLSEIPAHTHNNTAVRNVAGAVASAGGDKGEQTSASTSQGGDGAHSNTQPWIAKQRIIRF